MRVCVLGDIAAGPSGGIRPIVGPIQRRVFAVLVARRNETLHVSALVDACWPDEPPPGRAEQNMRSYVHRLRRAIGDDGELIETIASGYRMTTTGHQVDGDEFAMLARRSSQTLAVGDAVAAIEAADRALALWRGPPYAEFGDQPWAVPDAAHLDELHLGVRTDRCEALLDLGRPAAVVADLEQLAREDPLRERPRALLMRALYDSGRQVEALREFSQYRRLLIEEVGVEPSSELVELDRRLATGGTVSTPRAVRSYLLHERLGVGAFAVVHRATQLTLGRDVAIKIVRAELADNPAFIRRFEAEAQMVASIEHPNVVPLYDFWREPGQAFLVMRWMTGGSLETRLDDGPWTVETTADLVDQIAAALEAAHAREIVHRDVKPANILFDDAGRAFLGDFGIAMAAEERASTVAALSEGSPIFAAPEQLRGEPVAPAADVHALAIVAYVLLTGRTPFADAPDDPSALRHQPHDRVPPVSRFRPELPRALDEVLTIATAKAATDRHTTAGAFARAFRTAADGDVRSAPRASVPVRANPYVGLQAFGETDASVFHGRSRLVRELLDHLRQPDQSLLVLVGPSGAGKSSAVRAGLLPAIRSGALPGSELWFATSMIPGHRPYEALETALLRVAVHPPATLAELLRDGDRGIVRACKRILPAESGEIVLVIDQLEELFTSTSEDERDRFLRALTVAVEEPGGPVRVIATLRADFFDAPLRHPGFAPLVKAGTVAITPLAADELEEAITRPAGDVGVQFEPGLVAEILADVNSQPGALPLLQYALMRLYESAQHATITIADYRRIGGIAGALADRAEAIYDDADDDERMALRHLFERLVQIGDGPDDTRLRIRRSELPPEPATERMIERFGTARLLTFDRDPSTREPSIEIAHEALIRAWPRMSEWLDDDRDLLRAHRHVTLAAGGWSDRGRDPSELYRGARLERAEQLLADERVALNDAEREFLRASCAAREAEAQRERRRLQRLRRLTIASSVAALLALAAGVAAAGQWRRADRQADRAIVSASDADARAVESTAQRLAVQALGAVDLDPDLAILLALESYDRTAAAGLPTVAGALEGLHTVTQSSRLLERFPTEGSSTMSPSGARLALVQVTDGTREVVIVETSTRAVVARTPVDQRVESLAFVDDGQRLLVATQGSLVLLDAVDLTQLAAAPIDCCAFIAYADPDTGFVVTGHEQGDEIVTVVWEMPELRRLVEIEGRPGGWAGDDLIVSHDGAVRRVDVRTGETQLIETPADVEVFHVHPDGVTILLTTGTGRLQVAPLDGGRLGAATDLGLDVGVRFQWAGFTADGTRVYAAGPSGEVRLIPTSDEPDVPEMSLRGHPAIWNVAMNAAGDLLLASGEGEALLWDISPTGPPELGAIHVEGQVWRAELSDDGATMYVADQPNARGRMRAVELASGAVLAADNDFGQIAGFAVSPVATTTGIVAGWVGGGQQGRVLDLHSGRELVRLRPCDVPSAIDGDGRWMFVNVTASGPGCGGAATSKILDPMSGDVLLELPDVAGGSDIGPPGTISDGIAVYQFPASAGGLVFRDLRNGKHLGTVDITAWTPAFSPDGRYVTAGSADHGGFAIDVARVIAGDAANAIVLNPVVEGGFTSFSVVVGDRLITGHSDGVLRFWRLSDGAQELVLPTSGLDTTYIFPTPDGRYLYYENDGYLLRRFPLRTADLVELAERRAQRWFRVSECERYELAQDCDTFVAASRSTATT